MVETEQYRDQLDRLTARFPERETITVREAAAVVGVSEDTIQRSRRFPVKKIGRRSVVPIVALARWMS